MPDGDGRQVMAKAHMTLWVRQAKKCVEEMTKTKIVPMFS